MAYIPKSQIKENQFTSGAEWYYVKNNSSYTGFYYTLSNGTAYTGKNPNDPPNEEIILISFIESPQSETDYLGGQPQFVEYADIRDGYTFEGQFQNLRDVGIYGILMDTDYKLIRSKPRFALTFPTPKDYENTFFVRYFVCRINQLEYIEVDKETYDNIDSHNPVWMWENYIPFTLNWYIKGDIDRVFNNNKGSIFIAEKNIKRKGLGEYLGKKYLEYFEYPEANNLTTTGGELIYPTGGDYVGPYHIHKIQGPMKGSTHGPIPHQKLFYKRFYVGRVVDVLNQEGVIETGETQNIEYISIISTNSTPPSDKSETEGGY